MSNMNHDVFAQGGMQELSFDEIDEIAGGPLPAAVVACAASGACVAGVTLAATGVTIAAAAIVDFFN